MQSHFAGVRTSAWFSELPAAVRAAIVQCARRQPVAAGDVLARQGDAASQWICVASGALRLGGTAWDGREFTLALIGPNQWFGDVELVAGMPLDLDIVAHVDSIVLLVPKPQLLRLVAQFEDFGAALLRLNCQRLRHLLGRWRDLQSMPLEARVARELLRLARQFGRGAEAHWIIDIGLSQSDLAALVGCSRQRLNVTLRQLQRLGIIELGVSRQVVLDSERLRVLARGPQPQAGRLALTSAA